MEIEIYTTIFLLLQNSLFGCKVSLPEKVDWEAVLNEMKLQTVNLLPADLMIQKAGVPENIRVDCERSLLQQLRHWYHLLEEQQKVTELFREAGIPFAVVKGYAADIYYPKPEYRVMGDIDIIVCPEDYTAADHLLATNGYIVSGTENDRHKEFEKNGVEVELHWRFSIPSSSMEEKPLDRLIYDGIRNAEIYGLGAYRFPVLPKLINGLVLLQHISHHLEGGLGLRQVIDWMLYVKRELTDEYWETEFKDAAQRVGLEKLAVTATRMCQMYLGLESGLLWCREADDTLCEELMELIISKGNFGRKDRDSNAAIWILNGTKNPVFFAKLIQKRGMLHWRAAQKYPVLRPFAWLYQLGRYGKKGFKRKRPIRALMTDVKLSRKQRVFLDKVGAERRSREQ